MDPSSILLIMAPILFPLATKLGVHPVHLGVLMIVNTEVGLCHPPVGLNLYIASSIAKMGISEITIAVLPWLLAMLVFLGLITYVPEISLWLPPPARHDLAVQTPKRPDDYMLVTGRTLSKSLI
jgi:TRAP-type C4-dicarboxylate transport system, large permease component